MLRARSCAGLWMSWSKGFANASRRARSFGRRGKVLGISQHNDCVRFSIAKWMMPLTWPWPQSAGPLVMITHLLTDIQYLKQIITGSSVQPSKRPPPSTQPTCYGIPKCLCSQGSGAKRKKNTAARWPASGGARRVQTFLGTLLGAQLNPDVKSRARRKRGADKPLCPFFCASYRTWHCPSLADIFDKYSWAKHVTFSIHLTVSLKAACGESHQTKEHSKQEVLSM